MPFLGNYRRNRESSLEISHRNSYTDSLQMGRSHTGTVSKVSILTMNIIEHQPTQKYNHSFVGSELSSCGVFRFSGLFDS